MISAFTLERGEIKERILSENEDALWDPKIGKPKKRKLRKIRKKKRITTRLKINEDSYFIYSECFLHNSIWFEIIHGLRT